MSGAAADGRAAAAAISAELGSREVLLVCGLGGVGKTTTAAALGVAAALRGRRTAVLTIDPAPRLVDALGLDPQSDEPAPVPLAAPGELYGLVLDPQRVFDRALGRALGDPKARERILQNRIYRGLSGAVPGSEEFSAMERLYELHETGEWDLIVLDTPPSAHALDFLEAPRVLAGMLGSRALALVASGGRMGSALAGRGTAAALGALGKATGVEVMRDVVEFFQALAGATSELVRRAAAVERLLASDAAGAAVVTAPTTRALADSVDFARRVSRFGVEVRFLVANRVTDPHPGLPRRLVAAVLGEEPPEQARDAERALVAELVAAGLNERVARAVARAVRDELEAARHDRERLATLRRELPGVPLATVPRRARDVRSLEDVVEIAELLAPSGCRGSQTGAE